MKTSYNQTENICKSHIQRWGYIKLLKFNNQKKIHSGSDKKLLAWMWKGRMLLENSFDSLFKS